jgi:hypothetical protein
MVGMSDVRIMRARRFHTMEPGFPTADAVAVRGDRILAVGSFDTVVTALGDVPYEVDDTLSEYVVLPGLIDQHLHPLTGAAALSMEIVSTEDWVLPDHTATAANSSNPPPSAPCAPSPPNAPTSRTCPGTPASPPGSATATAPPTPTAPATRSPVLRSRRERTPSGQRHPANW